MEQVKTWVLSHCREAPRLPPKDGLGARLRSVLVTPATVPVFTIPKTLVDSPDGGTVDEGEEEVSSGGSLPCSANASTHSSPRGSPGPPRARRPSPCLLPPPQVQRSRSAPTSPCADKGSSGDGGFPSDGGDSDVDAMSLTLSLPHLKSRTCYGVGTLAHPPSTKRRESLFHLESSSCGRRSPKGQDEVTGLQRSGSARGGRDVTGLMAPPSGFSAPTTPSMPSPGSGESPLPSPSSPSSPSLPDSPRSPSPQHDPLQRRKSSRRQKMYFRRRSSLTGLLPVCQSCHKGAPSGGGGGKQDDAYRRGSTSVMTHTSSYNLGPDSGSSRTLKPSHSVDSNQECRCHVTSGSAPSGEKLEARLLAELGEVKISLEYDATGQEVRVGLLRAENLGGESRPSPSVTSYAKLCVMPGKIQQQRSHAVKQTKDPSFHQYFVFSELPEAELRHLSLRVRFIHKSQPLKRGELLGEVQLPLGTLLLTARLRVWRSLEPKQKNEVRHTHKLWTQRVIAMLKVQNHVTTIARKMSFK